MGATFIKMSLTYLVNLNESEILEDAGDRAPLGLLSIAANMPEETRVYDLNHMKLGNFLKQVQDYKPDNVGVSVYTSAHYLEAIKLAGKIRNVSPKSNLIAGGYHATAMPKTLLGPYDQVVRGEGETVMKHLSDFNENIIDALTPNVANLNNPDRTKLDMSKYGMNQNNKRIATLISSRGCPYSCAFCGKMSNKVRETTVDNMKKQIDEVYIEGFDGIYYTDDVFSLKKDRMRDILKYTKDSGLVSRVTSRADLINEEKAKIMSENGVEFLSLGIESGDNKILRKANKQMTTQDNLNAVRLANKYGIDTKGFFIIGLPGETEKTAYKTIEFARKLKDEGMKYADFYFLTPFPGTPIWHHPKKFDIEITDHDFSKYLQAGKKARCHVSTKKLTAGRIEELVTEAKTVWAK